jgi:hypothetical protein
MAAPLKQPSTNLGSESQSKYFSPSWVKMEIALFSPLALSISACSSVIRIMIIALLQVNGVMHQMRDVYLKVLF